MNLSYLSHVIGNFLWRIFWFWIDNTIYNTSCVLQDVASCLTSILSHDCFIRVIYAQWLRNLKVWKLELWIPCFLICCLVLLYKDTVSVRLLYIFLPCAASGLSCGLRCVRLMGACKSITINSFSEKFDSEITLYPVVSGESVCDIILYLLSRTFE